MAIRSTHKQLKNCEAALLYLESGCTQFNQMTRGLADALAAGVPLSYIQQTYKLNWQQIWQEIGEQNLWGPKTYQLWEWLLQKQSIQQKVLQLDLLISEYRLHIHPSSEKATDFWLGYDDGQMRYRNRYSQEPAIIGQPTYYEKGKILGWRYAVLKEQVENLLESCNRAISKQFIWG